MDKNNELINEFINASISYGEYQKQGNLEHENIYVRLQVAVSIIPIEPNKAKKALNELKNEKSLVAVEAEMILEQLEKGML